MNIVYSIIPNFQLWASLLDNTFDSDVMHSTNYFGVLRDLNYKTLFLDVKVENNPSILFLAYQTKGLFGISRHLIAGDRFGMCPISVNKDEQVLSQAIKLFDELVAANYATMSTIIYANIGSEKDNYKEIYLKLGYKEREDYICNIDLTMDLKDIWKRFEGRCRTAIRNAERYEPKICADNRENGVHDFYGIYRENATRKSFVNTRSKEYFKKLVYRFGEDNLIDLWSVEIKNDKVAAALVGKFKKKVSLLYLASTVKGLKYNINNLLIWKLIQRYQGEFSSFNMGSLGHSIYGSVSGYGKFKLGFNPKVIYSPQFVKYNKNWFFNLLKSEQSKIFLKFKNIFTGTSNIS